MKNFRTHTGKSAATVTNKISIALSLIMFLVVFSLTPASAQTQKAAEPKPDVKPVNTQTQTTSQEKNAAVPVEKKDLPVINDAIINMKDEQQYFEQKKIEQEKNKSDKKELSKPK